MSRRPQEVHVEERWDYGTRLTCLGGPHPKCPKREQLKGGIRVMVTG